VAQLACAALGAARGNASIPGYDAAVLSSLYDLAYAGVIFVVATQLVAHRRRAVIDDLRWGSFVVLLGVVAWPFLFRGLIATGWNQLAGVKGVLLLIASSAAISVWWLLPAVRPRIDPLYTRAEPSARVTRRAPRRLGDTLTGVRRLAWFDWTSTLARIAGTLVMFVLISVVYTWADAAVRTVEGLRMMLLLPFDAGTPRPLAYIGLLLFGTGSRSLKNTDWLLAINRHLRVLPLGRVRLGALLIGLPLSSWATVWSVLALVQLAVTGTPPAQWRWEMLAFLVGLDALARASQFRAPRDRLSWSFLLLMPVLVAVVVAAEFFPRGVITRPGAAVTVGALYFAAAIALNHLTLTRSRPLSPAQVPAVSV
jgi:hypothetical protein